MGAQRTRKMDKVQAVVLGAALAAAAVLLLAPERTSTAGRAAVRSTEPAQKAQRIQALPRASARQILPAREAQR